MGVLQSSPDLIKVQRLPAFATHREGEISIRSASLTSNPKLSKGFGLPNRSKRHVTIGLAIAVCLVGGIAAYLSATQNQRHISSLIDTTFEYTDLGLSGNKLNYNRQTYDVCGDLEGLDDAWAGFQAAGVFQQVNDVNVGAEPLARRLEEDGWEVVRLYTPAASDERVREIRYVYARKNASLIRAQFSTIELSVGAASGPCVPTFEFPPETPTPAERVLEFPD